MKKNNYTERFNGFTKSAWKSLAIKSIRIGWVEGLQQASKNLSKSEMTTVCVGSLFEDVFPIKYKDLDDCYKEIQNQEWEILCSRNTLHGRGYGQAFFDYAEESCRFEENLKYNEGIVRAIGINTTLKWINPRVYNCLYTWYKLNPQPNNYFREPMRHKWSGMPKNILDAHTYEGKCMGQQMTLLSGSYENHLLIANRVMKEGWQPLREELKADEIYRSKYENQTLF
jgi:hypothetical protein